MINSIIVEDEESCVHRLKTLLKEHSHEINILAVCSTVETAIRKIRLLNPDLVFLDVRLGGNETGFEIIEQMKIVNFQVIFTTGFTEYYRRAIRSSALDYLLKPINAVQLDEAIELYKLEKKKAINFQVLIHNLAGNEEDHMIMIDKSAFQIRDIIHCESIRGNCTTYHFNNNPNKTIAKTLKKCV